MPTLNESAVRRVLSINNRGLVLRAAIDGGWTAVAEKYPDRHWWRRKATRAGLVWEYAIDDAIKALKPDAGAHAIAHVDTVSFVFDNFGFGPYEEGGHPVDDEQLPNSPCVHVS